MQTAILILCGVIFLALLAAIYLYYRVSFKNSGGDASQKMMLELIENVRKEVQESGSKNRQEIQEKLLMVIQQVETPLLLTITTDNSCVVLGNAAMKTKEPEDKAHIYLLINSVLVDELSEWDDEGYDDE